MYLYMHATEIHTEPGQNGTAQRYCPASTCPAYTIEQGLAFQPDHRGQGTESGHRRFGPGHR